MKKVTSFLALSALLSFSAGFASDEPHTASVHGPATSETGQPVHGNDCFFSYAITKFATSLGEAGGSGSSLIIVQNLGTCRLKHIDVTDDLSKGQTFASATPTPTKVDPDGDHVRWDDQTIEAGQFAVYTVNVTYGQHTSGWTVTDNGCAFTPWINVQICSSAATQIR